MAWGRTAHGTAPLAAALLARVGAARTRSLALDAGLREHGSRHGTARRCSQGMDGRGSLSLAGA
eukprot:6990076-Prymnesium_polylepis.1